MVLQIIGAGGRSRIWSISIGWSSRPSHQGRDALRHRTAPLGEAADVVDEIFEILRVSGQGGGRDLQVGNRRYGLFGCHAGNNRVGGVHLVGDGIELRTDIGKELLELPIPVFVDFIAGHLFDFQGDAVDLVDYVLKLFKGFIQGGGRALEGQGMLPSLEIEACRAAVHADGMGFDAGTGIGEGVALHLGRTGAARRRRGF